MSASNIPLFKVAMSPDAQGRLAETLQSGYIGEGPRVEQFEQLLSDFLGAPVLATNSCTSALDLAYELLRLGDGDEVISTPMTCLATNMPLALRGCKIVWADVDPRTGNIDPYDVMRKVSRRTKAVVTVDWAGAPCNYIALRAAIPDGVPIIEDAAHAFGAQYIGRPLGVGGGDYVAWSFQAIKHLTTGDGGALKVPGYLYDDARLLRWYGLDRRSSTAMRCDQQASAPGFKYHMNDIAASIGLSNFNLAVVNMLKHRQNAYRLHKALENFGLCAPFDNEGAYWIYTILSDDRDGLAHALEEQGVAASRVHARNDYQECFAAFRTELPGLDEFARKMLSIPCGWWLDSGDLARITSAVIAHEAVHA